MHERFILLITLKWKYSCSRSVTAVVLGNSVYKDRLNIIGSMIRACHSLDIIKTLSINSFQPHWFTCTVKYL